MPKRWEEMTTDEKLEWLRQEDQSTRKMFAFLAAKTDEMAKTIERLENHMPVRG